MIVGVRNPEAVQKVFEDCGDAVKVELLCFFGFYMVTIIRILLPC